MTTKIALYPVRIFFLAVTFTELSMESAYAYLDPGTGSLILQGIIAGLAAVLVVGKVYWQRLLRFFGLGKSKPAEKLDNGKE